MYADVEFFLSSTSMNFFHMLILGVTISLHRFADVFHHEFAGSIATVQAQRTTTMQMM